MTIGLVMILNGLNKKVMYSLNCSYYTREFSTLNELIDDVVFSGMDPNYEITKNGIGTGEMVSDIIPY